MIEVEARWSEGDPGRRKLIRRSRTRRSERSRETAMSNDDRRCLVLAEISNGTRMECHLTEIEIDLTFRNVIGWVKTRDNHLGDDLRGTWTYADVYIVPAGVAAHPRGSCRLGRSRIHPVDGRWRRWLSGSDDLAARPEPAHRGREGRPDPGLVGAGAGVDGAGGGAGSAAAPAAQDAEQLQPAAIQGPQGEPAGG